MKTVKQSFTLVEILVVIVIIGILSSFIFFTINDSVEKASIAKSKMFSESIRNNLLLNLVSEWKLDGNANDSWGSNNGNPANMSYESEDNCISGQCGIFNGSSSIVNCGNNNSLNISSSVTISAWAKFNILNRHQSIVSRGSTTGNDNFNFNLEADGRVRFWINNTTYAYFQSITDTNWHYMVAVWNGVQNIIYLDGVVGVPTDWSPILSTSNANVLIGYWNNDTSWALNGLIDEIEIYNAAISETAIKQNYLSGLNNLLAFGNISEIEYNERIQELNLSDL
jgi:prepilin-type N-terminal cleavage/methylation domain-containing protein